LGKQKAEMKSEGGRQEKTEMLKLEMNFIFEFRFQLSIFQLSAFV